MLILANNHIRDYGSRGVLDTIKVLEEYHIPYLGAGSDLEHSNKSLILESGQYKIGLYSCTEHEFSVAGKHSAGAHPVEEGEDIFELQKLKKQTDYVICLYHGGVEFYPYPTPEMQARLRRYIYAGADLVVSQHSHCIGCTENIMAENWFMDREIFSLASDRRSKKIFRIRMHGKEGWYCKLIRKRKHVKYLFYCNKDGILDWDQGTEMQEELQKRNSLLQTPRISGERVDKILCAADWLYGNL